MNYDWIKSIPNYEKYLNSDHLWIIENFGVDGYIKMINHFRKSALYFGTKPITHLKKIWAVKNRHIDYNEAARTLDVSVKTIYNWRAKAAPENYHLFEETKEEKSNENNK